MKKELRKDQILNAACALFAQQGYSETTVAQIAKECGCSAPLIIRHYGSKENIYQSLLDRFAELCRKPIVTELPEGTAMQRLEKLYLYLTTEAPSVQETYSDYISALQSRGRTEDARRQAMQGIQDVGMEVLLPVLRDAVAEGALPENLPCEQTARLLWIYINGYRMSAANYPGVQRLPFDDVRRLLLEV